MPLGSIVVNTNFEGEQCPYQVNYDPNTDKFTATFNWVCRVGKDYFSPGWGYGSLTTSFDCANSIDEATVYHTNFGQYHPEMQNFVFSCIKSDSNDASYFSNFKVSELLNLRYSKLISTYAFEKLESICSCMPEDIHSFNNPEDIELLRNNEELEESHLFNPSNIALGVGATCLAAFGAFKAYQYLKSEKQIPFVEMDLPSDDESDDEDYIPEENNKTHQIRNRH